ncbi:MAG: hypothetical protein HYW93_03815 [Thaumarchaeota archaeon]|nr:hypothetical protein [Nitrososphaerota archaeon]
MPTEKQAHWRELQTLRRKYFKAKRENSVARMEDYAQQINDIEGKLVLQKTEFETPTETKDEGPP